MRFQVNSIMGGNKQELAAIGFEIHVVSSAGKPLFSWITRDGIQECRECCAGHGYLKGSS